MPSRKVPLAAESLVSSGTSVTSHQTLPPSPMSVSSPLFASSCGPTSPPSAPSLLAIRDPPQLLTAVSALGRARNGTLKASRPSKEMEDSVMGFKKRKTPSFSSSSFPAVDNHKRNGSSYHPTSQASGGPAAAPSRKKGLVREGNGLWSASDNWLSRADASPSLNSPNRYEGWIPQKECDEYLTNRLSNRACSEPGS